MLSGNRQSSQKGCASALTKKKVKCEFCGKAKDVMLYYKGHYICHDCRTEMTKGTVIVESPEKGG